MKHVPELDGLRALAVLVVVAFHAGKFPDGMGGYVGVDIFFVLSGYLITSILAAEFAEKGRIAIGAFYLRRFLRLMPALALLVAVYLACASRLWPTYGNTGHIRDGLVSLTYFSDYGHAFWNVPWYLRHTWSLAVEEHYYLIWPLLLPLILRAQNPVRIALVLYVGFALWRALNFALLDWTQAFYRFDTRLAGLLLGSWLALWLRQRDAPMRMPRWTTSLAFLALLVVILFLRWKEVAYFQLALPTVEFATAALIAAIVRPGASSPEPFRRLLSTNVATWIGRLSYGIYLWHFPISLLTRKAMPYGYSLALCLAISILFAWLSYHSVEAMGRRLRERFDRRVQRA